MQKNTNEHKEHRRRVKNRYLAEGLEGFSEVHTLELLLFFAIPQGDVNELAHQLLNHFGSLRQVLEAPVEQLMAVKGMGEHSAILVSMIRGLVRKYMICQGKAFQPLNTLEDCGRYLMDRFIGYRDEVVMLLCLDAKRKPIACQLINEGSVNSTEISVRKVMEAALLHNATTVILAHNHPSGIALPSGEDVVTTRRIAVALDAVGIPLADHIVVADRDFVSMVQSGVYCPEECRLLV